GTAGDARELGDRLVVVVSVDQGQLHRGVVAQLGRQPQGDMQPGVARASDHNLPAAPAGSCIHGVLHGLAPILRSLPGPVPGPPVTGTLDGKIVEPNALLDLSGVTRRLASWLARFASAGPAQRRQL